MIDVPALEAYCSDLLSVDGFDDYCPNGLQVEAGESVARLMTGVTACQALIDAACDWGADLLLVHHGFFWKGEPAPIRGMKGRRISSLIRGRVSLLAYHLPLDAHPELGNNRRLGELLGFQQALADGDSLLWQTALDEPLSTGELTARIERAVGRTPLHVPGHDRPYRRIGWCTGAAQSYLERAAALGLDVFISGEISEQTVHTAREMGVDYFAAGHHATERYGVQALGLHLAQRFGLEHRFVDIDNPV
ncbi:MAG: Nif3-like dinuclear metal center hexameric protein [Candidatus Thiodiazotropha sp.]